MHPSRTTAVLALACAANFMVVLDVSVVNVALPSIQRSLHFPAGDQQWVVSAYALTFAGFLLLGGRLADLYGRRRVFAVGLLLFATSSLVGGTATTPAPLVAARAVQGLGAAILAPATLTVLTTTFPEGPARTRALAIWTSVGVGAGAAGNLIGGVITEFLSWRAILLINVPLGALAVGATLRFLPPHSTGDTRRRLDLPGAVWATVGVAALVFGITRSHGPAADQPSTLAAVGVGVAALTGFVLTEARQRQDALIPLRLLRIRSVAVGNLAMLLAGACFNPMWYFLSFSMQDVLGYSALSTGLGFLPHTLVTMLVGARAAPWLMRHVPGRALISCGALIAAAGFGWQATLTPGGDYVTAILAPAVLIGVGGGLLNTPLTTAATSGVPATDAGASSGLMNTAKQLGGALGLAALVALVGHIPAPTPEALAHGYSRAFLAIAAILVAVAVLSLALPARRDTEAAATPRSTVSG